MQALERALETFDFRQGESLRVFHGRGQCYPGLGYINIDWFAPVLLVTLYRQPEPGLPALLDKCLRALPESVQSILLQRRYVRGAPLEVLRGELPGEACAVEEGLRFSLSFGDKQNIGFFMDMAPGRRWLQQRCEGRRVLNLFAYTCAFSVAAVAAGAHSVVNVDMSRAALAVGRDNHRLNDQHRALERDVRFLPYDLFRSWKRVIGSGPYDIVIIDPPSLQKGSFVAAKDYGRVLRRLPELLPEGGDILACLNAPELGEDFLHSRLSEHCEGADFVGRLPNRVDFPEADSSRNLKMLHFYLPPQSACR